MYSLNRQESTLEEQEFFREKENTVAKPWKVELVPLKYKSSIIITVILLFCSIGLILPAIITKNDFLGYFGASVFIFSVGGVVFWYSLSLEVTHKIENGTKMEFSGFYSVRDRGDNSMLGRKQLGERFEDMTVKDRRHVLDQINEEDYFNLGNKTYV